MKDNSNKLPLIIKVSLGVAVILYLIEILTKTGPARTSFPVH